VRFGNLSAEGKVSCGNLSEERNVSSGRFPEEGTASSGDVPEERECGRHFATAIKRRKRSGRVYAGLQWL
jgi:hypothetical protein